jgi:hypothetical protein
MPIHCHRLPRVFAPALLPLGHAHANDDGVDHLMVKRDAGDKAKLVRRGT